jgi:homoserine O-acetyltransferase
VALSGDWLFTPEQSETMVEALVRARKSVSYFHLDAPAGHDAFLTHVDQLQHAIRAFLPWVGPRPAAVPERPLERQQALEYEQVVDLVPPGSRVLDLGCGDGELLRLLAERKGVVGTGVEIDFDLARAALDRGSDVLLEDIDDGLAMIPDDGFDLAVLSETLQAMRRPRFVLREILRVARAAIVTFPNFGYLPLRAQLFATGRMPKSRHLPYEWYDTPNIHLFTLRDFLGLCRAEGIAVRQVRCVTEGRLCGLLQRLGLHNLAADRVIVQLVRGGE